MKILYGFRMGLNLLLCIGNMLVDAMEWQKQEIILLLET